MTRQTWVAFVAATVFVASAAVLALAPVPFVNWSPGLPRDTLSSHDGKPVVAVRGIPTYPTKGRLDMTTVSVTRADSRLTLPEAVLAYWLPHRDTLPRDAIYPRGKSAGQVEAEETEMMSTSQQEAVVAALRAADQPVTALPVVAGVVVSGPSHGKLKPADLILSVEGHLVSKPDDVGKVIRQAKIGDVVTFVVLRDHKKMTVPVTTIASTQQAGKAAVGITVSLGYRYAPDVTFGINPDIGGPSAGLVFSLAIYDKITKGALVGDRQVAGTGTIDAAGKVGAIGGIQEKIAGAEKAGATIFFVPAGNCPDLAGVDTTMELVRVATLDQAIAALRSLGSRSDHPSDRSAGNDPAPNDPVPNDPVPNSKVPHC